MKKLLYILTIVSLMTVTLVGCKKNQDPIDSNSNISSSQNQTVSQGNSNEEKLPEVESDNSEAQKDIYEDVNVFWNDVKGCWYSEENMLTTFTFDPETNEPLFVTGLMESSASLSGTAKFVDISGEDLYRIMINCPAVIYDDRVQSQEELAFIYIDVSRLSENVLTLKSHTGETAKWIYAGADMDEFYNNLQSTKDKFNSI